MLAAESMSGEELKHNHEAEAIAPHFLNGGTNELWVLSTVWWQDDGSVVQLFRVAPADRLRESFETALKALTSS